MKFVFLEIRSFYHRAPLLHRLCSTQKQISATAVTENIMALRTPEVLRMLEMMTTWNVKRMWRSQYAREVTMTWDWRLAMKKRG